MNEAFTLRRYSRRRSCLLCRARKVKCDRQQPWGGCFRAATTCIYPTGTGRAPKRPLQPTNNSAVLDRLERLETSLPPQGNQRTGRLAIDSTSSVYVSNVLWASLDDEIEYLRDLLHEFSSNNNDDDEEGVWHEETDEKEGPVSAIGLNAAIMGFRSLAHSLRDYHPSISQSVALFEIFQTNVAPVVKIFHMPTLTTLFWNAVASLDTLDCNTEALLFAIYYAAITSTIDQTQCPLGLTRPQALCTCRSAVEQALACADLLNTQNMVLLQAAALFLCALRNEDDSRTLCSLTALIIELRRRLWWFIVGLNQRSSEYHGHEPIISKASFDTRLPLNVNDSDLTADMVQPPAERDGATEMTLSLIGFESISIVRKVSFIPPRHRQVRTTSSASVTELSLPKREALAEQLQSRLETRYLAYCDPADPFLFVSATVARLIIARVWLMVHYPCKRADSKGVSAALLQASLQDKIFHLAIEILERSCSVLCNLSIAHWAWAWAVVEILYDRWRMKEHARKGTLWKPIERLMAKARYVREMQSVAAAVGGSSSVVEASPHLPQVARHNNVTATLDPLDDIFSLAPFMEVRSDLDDLFLVDDNFVQVDMRPG
ncbi:C6 transcription factor [Aspergillus fumigatus Z5]|nr:C6 transcription factor [Aspergillus fumigatus Z5]